MEELILNYLIDRSDQAHAQYALICPSCRREWRSTPGVQKQHAAAEAKKRFTLCPLCGSLVCADCAASVGGMQICPSCAERIK